MSKYPPFERVTAGRLNLGDKVLVRDGKADHWLKTAPGTYAVERVEKTRAGLQRRLYFEVMVKGEDGVFAFITVDPSVKLNRVTK